MTTSVSFRVLPVIDLKSGMAVHAVGGRRDQYRPLRGIWQANASPSDLLREIVEGLGVDGAYIADLDAIEGRRPDLEMYSHLASGGVEIWFDAGMQDLSSVEPLLQLERSNLQIVVGLESVLGQRSLGEITTRAGADRVIFSLDLGRGIPRIAQGADWPRPEPLAIVREVVRLGISRLILLDLAHVGTGRGTGTDFLLAEIKDEHPALAVTVGGGVRGIDDVAALRSKGASAVLVGSAFHDGRIRHDDLARLLGED